jgi:hypothetical protein
MGKQSKRPRRAARHQAADVHSTIRKEAEQFTRLPASLGKLIHAEEHPELRDLLDAAQAAIEASNPRSFEHEGRSYFLRASVAAHLDIFDEPGTAEPLLRGLVMSADRFGHTPGN